MQPAKTAARASVCLLADHLDAVLAGGEDLMKIPPVPAAGDTPRGRKGLHAQLEARRSFIESARTLEVAMVAHVLKAREHAAALLRCDTRFKPIADLFVASTHVLADAARDLGDSTTDAFDTGHDAVGFLRARGLIAADAAGPGDTGALAMTEEFRLAGVTPLGILLDLIAAFLDALDVAFDLYADVDQVDEVEEGAGAESAAA